MAHEEPAGGRGEGTGTPGVLLPAPSPGHGQSWAFALALRSQFHGLHPSRDATARSQPIDILSVTRRKKRQNTFLETTWSGKPCNFKSGSKINLILHSSQQKPRLYLLFLTGLRCSSSHQMSLRRAGAKKGSIDILVCLITAAVRRAECTFLPAISWHKVFR